MLLSFPLHNGSFCTNVLHNRSFFTTTSFCACTRLCVTKVRRSSLLHARVWACLGDRVRQCATEPKHFNVQCATEPGRARHGCAKVGWRAGPMSASPSLGTVLLLLHFVVHLAVFLVLHFAILLVVHFDKVQVPLLESLALGLACPWHHQPQQTALWLCPTDLCIIHCKIKTLNTNIISTEGALISTEGTLRRPMSYDNHPIHSSDI